MSDVVAAGSGFSIGRVASLTFAVIGRNLVPFLAMSIVSVLPQEFMAQYFLRTIQTGGKIDPSKMATASYWLVLFSDELLSIVLAFLLQAALVHGTIADLNGKPVSIGEAVKSSFRVFWPLIGLAIVSTLGAGVGFVLLVIPGIILLVMWIVSVPVLVVEHKGIFDSLSRSGDLTSGYRWSIFGIVIVFYVAAVILQVTVKPLAGLSLIATSNPAFSPLGITLDLALRTATSVVGITGIACLYYELRSAKEGIGPEQLASVFD